LTAIADLPTPALLLDLDKLEANLGGMAARARALGVALRPHIKTHKCIEIARLQRSLGATGITVSTLYEASVFAEHGFTDITWASPLSLARLPEAQALADRVTLRVIIDSPDALVRIRGTGYPFHVWLDVDCGYHRTGVDPSSDAAVNLARDIHSSPKLNFDGILTHSGHAYHARSRTEVKEIAETERRVMVNCADRLRSEGAVDVSRISVGSTPAMSVVQNLDGVTEARPGNYALYDYTQATLGSCEVKDCALTVLTSVVSSQPGSSHCVVDAGALGLSKDLGPDKLDIPTVGEIFEDYPEGKLFADKRVVSVTQEHGIVSGRIPVGEKLRILPNHSCLTVAMYDEFYVVRGENVVDRWDIWRGR
jgi:D-serine deaminase-like pyridoxal phosphate-dependent protein